MTFQDGLIAAVSALAGALTAVVAGLILLFRRYDKRGDQLYKLAEKHMEAINEHFDRIRSFADLLSKRINRGRKKD